MCFLFHHSGVNGTGDTTCTCKPLRALGSRPSVFSVSPLRLEYPRQDLHLQLLSLSGLSRACFLFHHADVLAEGGGLDPQRLSPPSRIPSKARALRVHPPCIVLSTGCKRKTPAGWLGFGELHSLRRVVKPPSPQSKTGVDTMNLTVAACAWPDSRRTGGAVKGVVLPRGAAPRTLALKVRCSTAELREVDGRAGIAPAPRESLSRMHLLH